MPTLGKELNLEINEENLDPLNVLSGSFKTISCKKVKMPK